MAATQRVDFFVLSGAEERSRWKLACRLAEQQYLAGRRVFIWLEDRQSLERLDELLWTFADRSFVPHEIFAQAQQWQDTPVLMGCQSLPAQPVQPYDVLVNLGSAIPASAEHATRIAELVDADEPRRRAGRDRFRQYRDRGLAPQTHALAAEDAPLPT
ncbi:MAG TPA: DNA polymerase III subunit chi [Steroidobacteraceae bacterium]